MARRTIQPHTVSGRRWLPRVCFASFSSSLHGHFPGGSRGLPMKSFPLSQLSTCPNRPLCLVLCRVSLFFFFLSFLNFYINLFFFLSFCVAFHSSRCFYSCISFILYFSFSLSLDRLVLNFSASRLSYLCSWSVSLMFAVTACPLPPDTTQTAS